MLILDSLGPLPRAEVFKRHARMKGEKGIFVGIISNSNERRERVWIQLFIYDATFVRGRPLQWFITHSTKRVYFIHLSGHNKYFRSCWTAGYSSACILSIRKLCSNTKTDKTNENCTKDFIFHFGCRLVCVKIFNVLIFSLAGC